MAPALRPIADVEPLLAKVENLGARLDALTATICKFPFLEELEGSSRELDELE